MTAQAQLLKWLESLGTVPPEVATEIQALIDNGSFDEAERRLERLERTRIVSVQVASGQTSASSYLNPRYAGASGGIVTKPTIALIGEAGPEAVVPLSQAPGASALGSGGGAPIINIYASVIEKDSARWIVEQIEQARLTMGAGPVQRAVGL